MKRLVALLGVVALVGIGAAAMSVTGEDSSFRVDAVFDTAAGLVPGQNVKVAGAKVGTVSEVKLLRTGGGGYKARIQMRVDSRFQPFRSDARCRILPEGLISENFIDCEPGAARAELASGGTGVPTVPAAQTAVPLSLQDVLDTFGAPTDQYVQVVLNEFGLATAGRGEDLNAILRRVNPALDQARELVSTLADQRQRVGTAVRQTDQVLAKVAARSSSVRGFVRNAATVGETTARREDKVRATLARLPALLDAMDRSLGPINRATQKFTPLLDELHEAAPRLTSLTKAVPPFTRAATPAFRGLGSAAATGRKAVGPAEPVVKHLRALTASGGPTMRNLTPLLASLRDTGGIEASLKLLYAMTTLVGNYDETSHMVTVGARLFPTCIIANMLPGKKVIPGCSHAFSSPGKGRVTPPLGLPAADASTASASRTSAKTDEKTLKSLLDYLLK